MKASIALLILSSMLGSWIAGCGPGDVGNLDSSSTASDMWWDDGNFQPESSHLHFNDAKNILILSINYLKDGEEKKLEPAPGQYNDFFLCMANLLKRFFEQEYPISADMLDADGQLKPELYSQYIDPNCPIGLKKEPKEGAPNVIVWTINHADDLIFKLEEYANSGQPLFDRIIYMGHGSPHGTIFFGKPVTRVINGEDLCPDWNQPYCYAPAIVGYNYPYPNPPKDENGRMIPSVDFSEDKLRYLENYGEKLRGVLSPTGRIHMGSCRSASPPPTVAGKTEPYFEGFENFIDLMACVTGHPVSGQNQVTSGPDSNHRVIWLENNEVKLQGNFSQTLVAYPNNVSEAYADYLADHPDPNRSFTFSCHSKRWHHRWHIPY